MARELGFGERYSRRQEFNTSALDFHFERGGLPEGKSERWMAANRGEHRAHRLTATLGGETVGTVNWNPHHGEIDLISVEDAHRGKGIAGALWGAAHVMAARHGVVAPRHSEVKFPAGQHWANKQTVQSGPGKPQPRRRRSGPVEGQESLF